MPISGTDSTNLEALVTHDPPLMITSYKIPKTVSGVSCKLFDMNGVALTYTQMVLSLQLECEEWQ